ncbi:putative Bacteriohemerythrin [Magnetospirillum sp. LM-5]|uniref:hemerythrin family protein n=1 Tax=Magnetospirillum sp. LM-5 TaxID=2681466 RepID=UPI001384202B|nr:hemerythrin family protein [Magnetospirillum sp. LM-5]CAA7612016.1 putative Bacteriohemerythrin [Magnetospirillum sp. LM-5]
MLIVWSQGFDIGHADIDDDHRVVVDIINNLNDSHGDAALVSWALSGLDRYVRRHFAREEALMRAGQYPDLEAHIALHGEFRRQIIELRDRWEHKRVPVIEAETLLILAHWWMTHIRHEDPKYVPWVIAPVSVRQQDAA